MLLFCVRVLLVMRVIVTFFIHVFTMLWLVMRVIVALFAFPFEVLWHLIPPESAQRRALLGFLGQLCIVLLCAWMAIDARHAPEKPPPPLENPPEHALVWQVGANEYRVSREQLDRYQAHLSALGATPSLHIAPVFKNGASQGVELSGIGLDTLPSRFGLRNGDVLLRLNDLPLTSPVQVFMAYDRARESSSIELELEREGQHVRQHYTLW